MCTISHALSSIKVLTTVAGLCEYTVTVDTLEVVFLNLYAKYA